MRVGAASIDLIGRWNFALRWTQPVGSGALDKNGDETLMQPLVLPFFVQIDPCPVTGLSADVPTFTIDYTVGDSPVTSDSFTFQE